MTHRADSLSLLSPALHAEVVRQMGFGYSRMEARARVLAASGLCLECCVRPRGFACERCDACLAVWRE